MYWASGNSALGLIKGLGDLSHASAVYSRDGRYAYVFGRDGGLTRVDLLRKLDISAREFKDGMGPGMDVQEIDDDEVDPFRTD